MEECFVLCEVDMSAILVFFLKSRDPLQLMSSEKTPSLVESQLYIWHSTLGGSTY